MCRVKKIVYSKYMVFTSLVTDLNGQLFSTMLLAVATQKS